MNPSDIIHQARHISTPFKVTDGSGFELNSVDPGSTLHFTSADKPEAKDALAGGVAMLAALQDKLYARDRWALLLVFQAIDAAGKDGTIKHVMSGVNPQGCQVTSFKGPSAVDLNHDYLWRCQQAMPERGRIGIFNRSYYENTLVVRVHPELLAKETIPPTQIGKEFWHERFKDIRHYEEYLAHNGIVVRKFFLHLSKKEQKRRFLERLDTPEKNWKFSANDVHERAYWDDYMKAFEEMIQHTSTPEAPWYVVPADNKWFTRLVVAAAVIDTLDGLQLDYPELSDAARAELAAAKRQLLSEPE